MPKLNAKFHQNWWSRFWDIWQQQTEGHSFIIIRISRKNSTFLARLKFSRKIRRSSLKILFWLTFSRKIRRSSPKILFWLTFSRKIRRSSPEILFWLTVSRKIGSIYLNKNQQCCIHVKSLFCDNGVFMAETKSSFTQKISDI